MFNSLVASFDQKKKKKISFLFIYEADHCLILQNIWKFLMITGLYYWVPVGKWCENVSSISQIGIKATPDFSNFSHLKVWKIDRAFQNQMQTAANWLTNLSQNGLKIKLVPLLHVERWIFFYSFFSVVVRHWESSPLASYYQVDRWLSGSVRHAIQQLQIQTVDVTNCSDVGLQETNSLSSKLSFSTLLSPPSKE